MTQNKPLVVPAEEVKSCCANVYESEWRGLLLGDSFHPGLAPPSGWATCSVSVPASACST